MQVTVSYNSPADYRGFSLGIIIPEYIKEASFRRSVSIVYRRSSPGCNSTGRIFITKGNSELVGIIKYPCTKRRVY
jgi:hypothetical protein